MKIQVDTAHSADRHARVDSSSLLIGLVGAMRTASGPQVYPPLALIDRVAGGMAS